MHFSFHYFFLSFTVGLKIVQQLAHKNMFERRKVHFFALTRHVTDMPLSTPYPEV